MVAMASQITSLTIVHSTVYSNVDQRKHQSSASLAFVGGIHRWPVNSSHKLSDTRKGLHLVMSSWRLNNASRLWIVAILRIFIMKIASYGRANAYTGPDEGRWIVYIHNTKNYVSLQPTRVQIYDIYHTKLTWVTLQRQSLYMNWILCAVLFGFRIYYKKNVTLFIPREIVTYCSDFVVMVIP